MAKYEKADVKELKEKADARKTKTQAEITAETAHESHLMSPLGIKYRECLASDFYPFPLGVAFFVDTSGSMGRIPDDLTKGGLLRVYERMNQMGSCGNQNPQLCMNGVADLLDSHPVQVGQYEGDHKFDDWLTRIQIGGGGGSERMHEAYMLALYVATRKTICESWTRQKKGHLFITGDEKCNPILRTHDVKRIFGDTINEDLHLEQLLCEAQAKWHISFLYSHTNCYRSEGEGIWPYWQALLGNDAYWLDGDATGFPEIVSAIIGINEGVFTANEVPQDLIELGCERPIVEAVAKALRVEAPPEVTPETGDGSEAVATDSNKKKKRPKRL